MAAVRKTTSDIQQVDTSAIVNIRVSGVSFGSNSGNAYVHRPRVGLPQSLQGHKTATTVSIQCYINRVDIDSVDDMVGTDVVVRFTRGGEARGVLLGLQITGEPASWETEEPYVEVNLNVATVSQKAGLL